MTPTTTPTAARAGRWLTVDLYYVVWYLPHLRSRPRGEKVKLALSWLGMLAIAVAAFATGHVLEWVVLYLLPMRLAVAWLGFAFNYHLVHHLHPVIPFHRYLAVWRRNESRYLDAAPELSDPRGRPITPEEYRALSAVAAGGPRSA